MGLTKPTPEEVDDLAVKIEQGKDVENLAGVLLNEFGTKDVVDGLGLVKTLKGKVFCLFPNGREIKARRIKQHAT